MTRLTEIYNRLDVAYYHHVARLVTALFKVVVACCNKIT